VNADDQHGKPQGQADSHPRLPLVWLVRHHPNPRWLRMPMVRRHQQQPHMVATGMVNPKIERPPQPYYQADMVTLYWGDCRTILPTLPHGSVDCIITDPPYGQDWQSGRRTNDLPKITGDDGGLDVPAALALALRALREARHLYVFGRYDLDALPLGPAVELIWDKEIIGPGDLTLPWGPQHEPITFAAYISRPSGRARGDGRLVARLRRGSVIRCQRHQSGQLEDRHDPHPTEKPVDLLRQLIESSSLLGETILDPFAGSGSTLLAARIEGRQAIGIEIEERWCEATTKRLAQGILPW